MCALPSVAWVSVLYYLLRLRYIEVFEWFYGVFRFFTTFYGILSYLTSVMVHYGIQRLLWCIRLFD